MRIPNKYAPRVISPLAYSSIFLLIIALHKGAEIEIRFFSISLLKQYLHLGSFISSILLLRFIFNLRKKDREDVNDYYEYILENP